MTVKNGSHGANARKQSMKLQRRTNGTFAPGNSGGPGGAAHRKSKIRRKLIESNADQAGNLLSELLKRGMIGDAACADVALRYILGEPTKLTKEETARLMDFTHDQVQGVMLGVDAASSDQVELACIVYLVEDESYSLRDALLTCNCTDGDARRWLRKAQHIQDDIDAGQQIDPMQAGFLLAERLRDEIEELPEKKLGQNIREEILRKARQGEV